MAKIVEKKNFVGVRFSDKFKEFIDEQCNDKQMSLNEYFNYLIREEIQRAK